MSSVAGEADSVAEAVNLVADATAHLGGTSADEASTTGTVGDTSADGTSTTGTVGDTSADGTSTPDEVATPPRSTTPVTVHIVEWTHPDAESLRALQRLEIAERYGRDDSEPGPAPTADDIAVFMVAYSSYGHPVACGGLRQLDPATAEIKRMFVVPASRGSGASVAVLQHLEQYALGRGWDRLRLETGTAQPDAVRFYEREGYQLIESYGHYARNADSICYEKVL
jgi:putative acetyltransferase